MLKLHCQRLFATNAIIHGYEGKIEKVYIECQIKDREMTVAVIDHGCGIPNVEKAMEPLYTTKKDSERSGMGFELLEARYGTRFMWNQK